MLDSNLPLLGFKVVDISAYAAAPMCARLLGEMGADVIKVEPLTGDPGRQFSRTKKIPGLDLDDNPTADTVQSYKRSLSIDLRSEKGMAILNKLLETADVLVTNYRTDALKRLNVTYEELAPKFPRLIYAAITGYGEEGPLSQKPGFDYTAYWTRGGVTGMLGEPDAPPLSAHSGFGDIPTGTFLCMGICAALVKRERTGKGDKVNAALYHGAMHSMSMNLMTANFREMPKNTRYVPNNPFANPYQCKCGQWIVLCILEFERYFKPFYKTLGLEELIEDERFNTLAACQANTKELTAKFDEAFAKYTRDEWITKLDSIDVVYELVFTYNDILKDEQAIVNDFIRDVERPNGFKYKVTTMPVKFQSMTPRPHIPGPKLAEHTQEIMLELGYSMEEIKQLEADKAINIRKV